MFKLEKEKKENNTNLFQIAVIAAESSDNYYSFVRKACKQSEKGRYKVDPFAWFASRAADNFNNSI